MKIVLAGMCLLLPALVFAKSLPGDVTVSKDGSGNFTSVQDAIDAAPAYTTIPFTIFIKNGWYKEKICIPASKPYIHLTGESAGGTVVYYDEYITKQTPGVPNLISTGAPGMAIYATDFSASNISFSNTAGDEGIAIAVLVNNDRAAFKTCRFTGSRGTVCINGAPGQRTYFRSCYIDGTTDLIFGTASAVFDSCVMYSRKDKNLATQFICSSFSEGGPRNGFIFRNCNVTGEGNDRQVYLSGSAKQVSGQGAVVFLGCTLSKAISQEGWLLSNDNAGSRPFFAEYQSNAEEGEFINAKSRPQGVRQLGAADLPRYTIAALFGSWEPCTAAPGFCATDMPQVAVGNFKADAISVGSIQLSWNLSWPVAGTHFELYRSFEAGPFMKLTDMESTGTRNFVYTDDTQAAGLYHYVLQTSKEGSPTQVMETMVMKSASGSSIIAAPVKAIAGSGTGIAIRKYKAGI